MKNQFLRGSMLAALSLAGALHAADYTAWTGHRSIVMNTSATGANVATTVTNFPLLVRLGSAESAILAAAGTAGASIRFSKADNATPLPYQIESWSATSAAIWVKVDTIKGNDATQLIRLHWGNGSAVSESNANAVFDTAAGFRGVWHLGDSTGRVSTDATVHATNAAFTNAPLLTDGLIGKAINLNQPEGVTQATANYLTAPYNTVNNNFKVNSTTGLTLSMWVKRNASTGGNEQGIFGRYNWEQNGRQAMIATNGSDQIRLFRSTNGTNSGGAETNFGTQTIVDGEWMHIAATLKNGSQILYVNGVQDVAQTTATIGSLDSIWPTKSVLAFGHMAPDHSSNPVNQAFNGVIDEARYTARERSADWLKLEFANQKAVNTLIDIGQPSVPGAPTAVTGVSGNTSALVSWTAPASNGGVAITSYKAMVVGADSARSCVTQTLSCTITGLTNGTAYTFVVRATNSVGAGVLSTPSPSVTPNPVIPGAPGSVSATILNSTTGAVTVTWTVPGSNGGAAITAYNVTSAPGGFTCSTTGALTCVVQGLTVGTSYSFTVRATNSVGQGPASAASNMVTAATPILGGNYLVKTDGFARAYTFRLPESALNATSDLTMTISDVFGRTVWSKSVSPAEARVREISWNGKTSTGSQVSAGMYIVRVKADVNGQATEFRNQGISLNPGQ